MRVELLIIDPQVDFCDPGFDPDTDDQLNQLPSDVKALIRRAPGKLLVPGAEDDMKRAAAMVKRIGNKIDDIHVTLDSHHLLDQSHPLWWKDSHGNHPDPFTNITVDDVENGVWTTSIPGCLVHRDADGNDKHIGGSLNYLKRLKERDRYDLTVWPPHCLIGSDGAKVLPVLQQALEEWENENMGIVDFITKGSNIWTEHYGAVEAEVPDPDDIDGTGLNSDLIRTVKDADDILLLGEAGSHCLANTGRDIANGFGDESCVSKFVLLTDATSPVPGFESLYDDFVKELTDRGMRTSTTVDYLA